MMKLNHILAIALLSTIMLTGCQDVLDKKNLSAVTSEDTWNDPILAEAFLDKCYADNLPAWEGEAQEPSNYSDETRGGDEFLYGQLTSEGGSGPTGEYWPYDYIFNLNTLLANINTGSLDLELRRQIEGQALFLRSYRYFELVKRYGGVPLVLEPQERDNSEVPRESTSKCIEQIINDLDMAASVLPDSWDSADKGRITRGAALALKGRVLLFYASKQFNRSNDIARWQTAYDANMEAKTRLLADGYGLNDDFDGTWKNSGDECELSKEVIFASRYANPARKTDINAGIRPLDYSQGKTGWNQPVLDMVMAFPMADGTEPGVIVNGVKKQFNPEATDETGLFWLNRDPRFYKTVVTNGMLYPIVDNPYPEKRQFTYKGGEVEIANASKTGFYSCKFIDPSITKQAIRTYDLDLVEIRFAEVLLNLAECAAEVGGTKAAEAVQILKDIRGRAGITANGDGMYGLKANMTQVELIEAVLFERRIELAYEGKRFWDMRRRMMFSESRYKNYQRKYIQISTLKEGNLVKVIGEFCEGGGEAKMESTQYFEFFKTVVLILDDKYRWDVPDNYYFFALPKRHLEQNSLLKQTAGWNDGTFDPLL